VRGLVWQLLLGVSTVSASSYSSLVSLGPCQPRELYSKIRGDCFRTFQDDELYWAAVDEAQMSRVLNAFVHLQGKTFYKSANGVDKGEVRERKEWSARLQSAIAVVVSPAASSLYSCH